MRSTAGSASDQPREAPDFARDCAPLPHRGWTCRPFLMPSLHIIDPRQKLLLVAASGTLTAQLYRRQIGALQQDPRFDPGFSLLFDVRGATDVRVSHDEMLALTARPILNPTSRRAIVATEGLVFGMARMYELSFADSATRRVFDRIEAATEWLGIDYAQCLRLPVVTVTEELG